VCGISGIYVVGDKPPSWETIQTFCDAWRIQYVRGVDATGIFAIVDQGGVRKLFYAKAPLPAYEYVPYVCEYWRQRDIRPLYAIAHARAATHGSPLHNVNNHPIVHIHGNTVNALVHNGVVHDRVCPPDDTVSETDTEHILCKLERTPFNELTAVTGSAAILYMSVDVSSGIPELKHYIVYRQTSPLEVYNTPDTLIFASQFSVYSTRRTSIDFRYLGDVEVSPIVRGAKDYPQYVYRDLVTGAERRVPIAISHHFFHVPKSGQSEQEKSESEQREKDESEYAKHKDRWYYRTLRDLLRYRRWREDWWYYGWYED